jgi:hypothetical protein
MPVAQALDDLSYEQVIAIAEIVLRYCSRENEERPITDSNKRAFDKLVAEIHYDYYDFPEIKEAIEDYYN